MIHMWETTYYKSVYIKNMITVRIYIIGIHIVWVQDHASHVNNMISKGFDIMAVHPI